MNIQTLTRRIPLTPALRSFVRQHLADALERFARSIASITVELYDKNGRRGGGDKRCRIRILLAASTTTGTLTLPVLVEDEQASIREAIRHAASRAAQKVRAALR
jgi:ribosome-associated translation inhibitor RaiA